jgi:DNA adenine methylase
MNSPFGWPGGKKCLVKKLLPLLPPHRIYVEPFCGSAKLLFAKPRSEREVISDANGDLINFFLVAKFRPSALAQKFELAIAHPTWFKSLRSQDRDDDEVTQAFRFAYLNWFSFGSKGEHFANRIDQPKKNLDLVARQIQQVAERLRHVVVECGDYEAIIRRYDSPDTLFYCDPPYVSFQSNGRYQAMPLDKLNTLFQVLGSIKGKFLLSEQNHPEVMSRTRAADMSHRRVQTTYSLGGGDKSFRKTELLIANFRM